MRFSSRTDWTAEANELSKLAGSLRAAGTPFLDLTVSNPTQCGFQYLNPALNDAFRRPENLEYHPDPRGLTEAREAVLHYYKRRGIVLQPEQIFLTANTSEAYSFLFRLLFEPGEILLAPQPSYPLLDYLASLHDLQTVRYPLLAGQNWKMKLEETVPSKAVLAVNYNNPTGSGLHQDELASINKYCLRHGAAFISDEVFLDYPLQESHRKEIISAASNTSCLTFTLSGISKVLGLPQMKLSWIVVTGPESERKEALQRLEIISDTYLSASTPVQNALKIWFQSENVIQKEILERVRGNYDFLAEICAKGPLKLIPVQGGWHVPIQMPGSKSDDVWALDLLKNFKVLTHPGYLFDFEEPNFLVLSLLIPTAVFQEGLQRIIRASH